jgi:glycosyltransferase involved in cell wall biosynthesis
MKNNHLSLGTVSVCSVTVTYGRRWHLLRQVLTSAFKQGVDHVIVIDNASQDTIALKAMEEFGNKVQVVTLDTNTGSANGYKIGLEEALNTDAEYIWLLDDDNLPQPGALESLLKFNEKLRTIRPLNGFALLSFRPEHQADIAAGVPLRRCYPRPGSFFGFHVLDIPYKLWRRTIWGKPRQPELMPEYIPVPFAPYSGFFCHRSVIDRIGLPNDGMVLYADDTEFTSRLEGSGGQIFLIPVSRIDDLETSWNTKSRFSSSFLGWLCGSSDFRAFYGARNQAYFEAKRDKHKIVRSVNRAFYLAILTVVAVLKKRMSRLRLLADAIRSGEAGLLGVDDRFPFL